MLFYIQHYVHACDGSGVNMWVKGQTGAKVHGGGWLDGVYPQIGDWGLGTGDWATDVTH